MPTILQAIQSDYQPHRYGVNGDGSQREGVQAALHADEEGLHDCMYVSVYVMFSVNGYFTVCLRNARMDINPASIWLKSA